MELVYLWIKNFKVFNQTGFHFRNTYQFTYDYQTFNLHIKTGEFEKMQSDFFGSHISNLSVVVGDNGAGKSTLLGGILHSLASSEEAVPFIAGFYVKEEHELRIYSHDLEIKEVESKGIKAIPMDEASFEGWIKKSKIVYVSNVLDLQDYSYPKPGMVHDASVGGLLRLDHKNAMNLRHIQRDENQIYHFYNSEIYRQIDFLYHYKTGELDTDFFFNMLKDLQVNIVEDEWNRRELYLTLHRSLWKSTPNDPVNKNIDIIPKDEIGELLTMISDNFGTAHYDELWKIRIADHLITNAIRDIAEPNTISQKRTNEIKCLLKAYRPYRKGNNIFSYGIRFMKRAGEELLKTKSIYLERLIPYLDFLKWLESEVWRLDVELDKVSNSFRMKLNDNNKIHFQTFFELYNRTCRPFYYLNFSWGLSTGQSNLLSLYARLHAVLKPNVEGGRSQEVVNHDSWEIPCTEVLLLIDEADLSYHPKWQVQYISRLLELAKTMFPSCMVQIILTTHSPMLLSDIPRSHVIYLKDGLNDSANDHEETFGQNVYTLYNDAFFMEHQTVGLFSSKKIKEIGTKLNEWTESLKWNDGKFISSDRISHLEEMEYMTSIIGEQVIRKGFENKLQRLQSAYRTTKLNDAISMYDQLSQEDRNRLIDHIIKINEKDQTR